MNFHELQSALQRPGTIHRLIGGYTGPYGVGITFDPFGTGGFSIAVNLPPGTNIDVPTFLHLQGERIAVRVNTDFSKQWPQGHNSAKA